MDVELLIADVKNKILYFNKLIGKQSQRDEYLDGQRDAYEDMLDMIEVNIKECNME